MQAIFNDASELSVQQVTGSGDHLQILSLEDPAALRAFFEDPIKTRKITVQERGQTIAEYEGYTDLYGITWTPGGIYIVTMYKPDQTPEVQTEKAQAAIRVAELQAAELPDAQALEVKALYKDWEDDPVGYEYDTSNPEDRRRNYNGRLWNLNKDHEKSENWYPGADPTLWTEIVEGHAGTMEDPIPVPDSVTTSGFEYVYGKYYIAGGVTYLCKRGGIPDEQAEALYGQPEKLYFPPSAMVGQYFEISE